MYKAITLVFLFVLTAGISGCGEQQNAAAGEMPATFVPIGPVPGFGNPPRVQSDPFIHQDIAITQGRKLFVWYNCAGCHGGHGGGGMGPSLRDPVWIYGDTDANIFDSISQGRSKGMPAWGLKLPEQQIWQLVTYIKSMRTPQEAEPPE